MSRLSPIPRVFYVVIDQLAGHWREGVEAAPGFPPVNVWGYHKIGRIPHFSRLIEEGMFAFTWNRRECMTACGVKYLATGCYNVGPVQTGDYYPRTEANPGPMGVLEAAKRHYPDQHMATFTTAYWINPGYFYVPDISHGMPGGFPDDRMWGEFARPYFKRRRDWRLAHVYITTMDMVSLCPSYTPEEPSDCRKTKDAYVRHLDQILKEMIELLSEDGGWERTLIVIASDHGYHAGCNVAKAKGAKSANFCADHPPPYDCHVWDFEKDRATDLRSDCARRTTCIVSGGALPRELRGTVVPEAEIIDVAPTVADALDVPFPCEGKSLLIPGRAVRGGGG